MNKKMNVLKIGLALAAAMVVTGCASLDGIAKKNVSSSNSGEIYGVGFLGIASEKNEINDVCDAINNSDERCSEKVKYKTVFVVSKLGFADGPVGLIALAEKSMNTGKGCVSGSKDCTYLKVKSNPGKLATIIEIASNPGDNKCHWSGMPRIGGVVCTAYNWDYSKEGFIGIAR